MTRKKKTEQAIPDGCAPVKWVTREEAEELYPPRLTDLEWCEQRAREIAADRLVIERRPDMTLFLDGERILFKVIPGCEENAASLKRMREWQA